MGVSINVLMAAMALITQLTMDRQTLLSDSLESSYTTRGYRHGDVELFKAPNTMTYKEATEYCRDRRQNVFQVETDFKLGKIFQELGVVEVWTPLVKSRETGNLMDGYGFSPPPKTIDTLISLSDVTLATMVDESSRVTLKYVTPGSEFRYVTTKSDQRKEVLCLNNLSFPYREIDLLILSELKSTLLGEMEKKITSFQIRRKWLQALMKNTPKAPHYLAETQMDTFFNMTDSFYTNLKEINGRFGELMNQLGQIRAVGDVSFATIRFLQYLADLEEAMTLLVAVIENPATSLESNLMPDLKFDKSTPTFLYQNSSEFLLIHFLPETKTEDFYGPEGLDDQMTPWDKIERMVYTDHFWTFTFVDSVLVVTGILVATFAALTVVIRICSKKKYLLIQSKTPKVRQIRMAPSHRTKTITTYTSKKRRETPEQPEQRVQITETPVFYMDSDLSLNQI